MIQTALIKKILFVLFFVLSAVFTTTSVYAASITVLPEVGDTWVDVKGNILGTAAETATGTALTVEIATSPAPPLQSQIVKTVGTTLTITKGFQVKVEGLTPKTRYLLRVYETTTPTISSQQQTITTVDKITPLTPSPQPPAKDAPGSYSLLAPLPYAGSPDGYLSVIDQNFKISDFVKISMRILIGIAGVLAVIMIIVVGVQLMTTDSFSEKSMAKERMMDIIGGLVLALCSVLLLGQINPDLLEIRFGNMKKVSVEGVDEQAWLALVNSNEPLTGGGGAIPPSDLSPSGTDTGNDITDCKNPNQHDALFKASALKYGVSCTLLKAIMCRESRGNPNAVSGKGAVGLMQIMPATAKGLGFTEAEMKEPAKAIEAGAKLNKELRTTACGGKPKNEVCDASQDKYVLARYNASSKANNKSVDCPNPPQTQWQCLVNGDGYKETRHYVERIANNVAYLKQQNMGCD